MGDHAPTPVGQDLLVHCAHRAMDKMDDSFARMTADSKRSAFLAGISPVDKAVLSGIYKTISLTGLAFGGLSIFPLYRFMGSQRPFLCITGASFIGSLAGVAAGFRSIGPGIKEMVAQPTSSSITDDILCPVIDEFRPCEQDALCRKTLDRGDAYLLKSIVLCREKVCSSLPAFVRSSCALVILRLTQQAHRRQQLTTRGNANASVSTSTREMAGMDLSLADTDNSSDSAPVEVDPFFSGGFKS